MADVAVLGRLEKERVSHLLPAAVGLPVWCPGTRGPARASEHCPQAPLAQLRQRPPADRQRGAQPLTAFPSWFMRITCDRCGKDRMLNETHAPQRDMLIRDIIAKMRHDGCGGQAGRVELLTGIEGRIAMVTSVLLPKPNAFVQTVPAPQERVMNGKRFLGQLVPGLVALSCACNGATLDHLRQDGTIRIAYRRDAPPFSYQNADAAPGGFIIDLCQAVAKRLSQQLGVPPLKVSYVPVTASDRFEAIQQNSADLLCEATTATLSRRKIIDFSIDTFVDGASLITTSDGPTSIKLMAGKTIGVLAGTTTEQALKNALAEEGIAATVTPVTTHADGLTKLDSGELSAYFADRSILWVLQASSKAPDRLLLADRYLTIEPYALGLPRGDDDFRFEIDRALSGIYQSGEIVPILARTFGDKFQLSPMLQSLYLMSAIPD